MMACRHGWGGAVAAAEERIQYIIRDNLVS